MLNSSGIPRLVRLLAALLLASPLLPAASPPNTETTPGSPMPAAEAAAAMELPPGFKATVFAAEPEVRNPIGCAWDSMGRLWVAENYTYERRRGVELPAGLHDRVLIFEDTDGDGAHDDRIVFAEGLSTLTSIEWSPHGLYLMCPPNLLFIPDMNRDDRPDRPARVVLDGFTEPSANNHNFANGLRWGPDGWLYGRCGASAPGMVGVPGTPDADRIPLRGTLWRYHLVTKVFEALSHGTTNPWGHDWDQHGQLFFINTVNGHFWHHITGSHLVRSHTVDPNPYVYELLDHHADHWHFDTKGGWGKSRHGAANDFGGGHAHIGMMIYQGDNWPEEYRHSLFTINMHGRRANREILERRGSGYVAKHAPDFLLAADPFFRGLELTTGPDGAVYVLDWSDTGECHENTGVHRTSGRIFRITHGTADYLPLDFSAFGPLDFIRQHVVTNPWFSRMAALELQHEHIRDPEAKSPHPALLKSFFGASPDPVIQLRALWNLYRIEGMNKFDLHGLLDHESEHVRVWAIRLLTDHFPLDTIMSTRSDNADSVTGAIELVSSFGLLAREDPSPLVRLTLASALQRFPVRLRSRVAEGLVSHAGDAGDHNLPLAIWYSLIPVAEVCPGDLVGVATVCELPLVRRHIARRLAEGIETHPEALNNLLSTALLKPEAWQRDLVAGLTDAFRGWQQAPPPEAWSALAAKLEKSKDANLRENVRDLAVLFGDGRALEEVKRVALDRNAPLATRKAALRALIKGRHPDLKNVCSTLVATKFLNPVAAQGLVLFDDPDAAMTLASSYQRFHPHERPLAIGALSSRPLFAHALLDCIAKGKIPREALTAFHARQIRSFQDEALSSKLTAVWGDLRDTPADKRALIGDLRERLQPTVLASADLSMGRTLYNQACATCHKLYGEGNVIGPDLTGSGRANLDYLLENIIAPGTEVSADYQMTVITLKDGRVLNGFIRSRNKKTITLQTMTEEQTLEQNAIAKFEPLPVSLMPEGLLEALSPDQQRDLIAYLMHPNQVPLP